MMAIVLCYCNATLVARVHLHPVQRHAPDFVQKVSEPNGFLRSVTESNILSFSIQLCNNLLIVGRPGNSPANKERVF